MIKAYDDGMQAFKDGLELWQNPYAGASGGPAMFSAWMAGWCFAKQNASMSSVDQ